MRTVAHEAASPAKYVFAGMSACSGNQTPRRTNSIGMHRGVTRRADSPSQKHLNPFMQQFSEFAASVASHRSQSQPNSQVRKNSARHQQQHLQQQQQQQQHHHQFTERRASTPRGSSSRQRNTGGANSQHLPHQDPATPPLQSLFHTPPPCVRPVHAAVWSPYPKFVESVPNTPTAATTSPQDSSFMTPSPPLAPSSWKPLSWQDLSVSSRNACAGLGTQTTGNWTPHSASYSSMPTLPPEFSEVASIGADCSTTAVAQDVGSQNHRNYGRTIHRVHLHSADEVGRTAKFSGGDHFATWTKAREVAEVVLQRADTAAGSFVLVPEESARALSEPPILSRLYALRRARRRLSAGRRIAKLMALKAELQLQSTLDAWRIIIREARHRQEMRVLERQAEADEVVASRRALSWQRRWTLRETLGCWRSFTVSAMLARRPKKKARWQRPTLADQVAVVLQRVQFSAGLLRVLFAWNRLIICERRVSAELLVTTLRRRCLEQSMHIIGSVTFRVQVGALLASWKRISELAWRERAMHLLTKAEGLLPDVTCRQAPSDEAGFAATCEAADQFRKVLEARTVRDILLAWSSCVSVTHAKKSLNSITDQMQETRIALANLGAAARELRLQRGVLAAWASCIPLRQSPSSTSIDSLAFSLDSSVPPWSNTLGASIVDLAAQRCTPFAAWQASATLPSKPCTQKGLEIHQPLYLANSSPLSETLPARFLNGASMPDINS